MSVFVKPRTIPQRDLETAILKKIQGLEHSLLSGAFALAVHASPLPSPRAKKTAPSASSATPQRPDTSRSRSLGGSTPSHSPLSQSSPTQDDSNELRDYAGMRALYHLYCVLDIATRRDDVPNKKSVAELVEHSFDPVPQHHPSFQHRSHQATFPFRRVTQTVDAVTALPRLRPLLRRPPRRHPRVGWSRVRSLLPRLTLQSLSQEPTEAEGLHVTEHNKQELLSRHEAHLRHILTQRRVTTGLYEYKASSSDPSAMCCDVGHSAGDGSPGWIVHAGSHCA